MAVPSRTRQYQQIQLLLVYHRILNVNSLDQSRPRLMGLSFHTSIPEHDGLCSSHLMSFQRPHTEATRPWTGPLSSECSLRDARPGQRPNVVQQRSAFVPLVVASQVTCLFFYFAFSLWYCTNWVCRRHHLSWDGHIQYYALWRTSWMCCCYINPCTRMLSHTRFEMLLSQTTA